MTTYVIDAYGLAAIGEIVDASKLKDVKHALTDLVINHDLRYPSAVHKECCKYMDENGMGLWAKAASGHLPTDASTYEHQMTVLNEAYDLVDPFSDEEQTQVEVAKMAVWLTEAGHDVRVVTDDNRPRPDRISLEVACQQMQIPTCDAATFLTAALPFSL